MLSWYDMCLFFFQAEDGIRDLTVTGVQTCALPIFSAKPALAASRAARQQNGQDRADERTGAGDENLDPALVNRPGEAQRQAARRDRAEGRKSGVEGKRGDLGGRRIN